MTGAAPDWAQNLVPEGTDFLDGLTVREMDIVSRKLGCSVEVALKQDQDGKKWAALAHVAWLWDKRRNPTEAKLDRWFDLTGEQLADVLVPDEPETDDEDQAADQLEDQPDAPTVTREDVAENPTDSAPA